RPEPWLAAGGFPVLDDGLFWISRYPAQELELRVPRFQLQLFASAIVAIAALSILLYVTHHSIPSWNNPRNFGPFLNRNQTADLFGVTSVLILASAQDDIRHGRKRWILWAIALIIFITAICLNFSRAGIVILVAASAIWIATVALRLDAPTRSLHPESDWLWVWSELGWVAVPLILLGAVLLVWRVAPLQVGTNQRFRLAALIGALMFALHGLVDVSSHRVGTAYSAMFLLGLSLHRPTQLQMSKTISWIFRILGVAFFVTGLSWTIAWRSMAMLPGAVGVGNAKQLA